MEKERLFLFKNEVFEVEVKKSENGEPLFNAEMVAKNLGFKRTANSGNDVVRWDRVNKYLSSCPQVGTVKLGDYIPEYIVYKLAFKANNAIAEEFQDWLAIEVIPQIRKTGGYIPIVEDDTPELIMAKALKVADETIKNKDFIITERDKLIAELRPDAELARDLINRKGLLTLKQVSDNIQIGRTTLCSLLRKKKVLSKQSGYNEPMYSYIKSGYFTTVVEEDERTKHVSIVTLVTSKGLKFVYRLIKKNDMLDEFDTSKLLEVL